VLRAQMIGDSWLALIGGREIVAHGLPQTDTLFLLSHGRTWVDQQWLGQLGYYAGFAVGGVRLVLVLNCLLFVAAGVIALNFARLRGASPRTLLLVAPLLPLMAPWSMQVRTQTMGELLFAATLGLLALERPLRWRRAAVVLALLMLWANVHGSVVIGAVLAMLYGLAAWRNGPGRALLFLSPLCVFASPYGFALAGYYNDLLANDAMSRFVAEWKHSTPGPLTAVFYVCLIATGLLLVRYRKRVRIVDAVAVSLVALAAVLALRSIVWFSLAAVIVVAPLLDIALARRRFLQGPVAALTGATLAASALVAGVIALKAPTDALLETWPTAASDRVEQLARNPSVRVFADDTYADWLLWAKPSLRGRIAYDARFELLTQEEVASLARFAGSRGARRSPLAAGYEVFVYPPEWKACPVSSCREVFRDGNVVIGRRSG
jgi:hypothetical protein